MEGAAVAQGVAMIMAGVLLWAGLEKARDHAPVAATIRELGFPFVLAAPAALLLASAEIAIALAVIFRPGSTLAHMGVILFAGLFALAGLIAVGSGKQIRCRCFGTGGNANLGKSQVIAFIPWFGGAVLLRVGAEEAPSFSHGAAYFAATSLAITCVRGLAIRKKMLEARGDRLSAQEMYRWLRSH